MTQITHRGRSVFLLPALVYGGFLLLTTYGMASPIAAADVPDIRTPPRKPLSVSQELQLANDYLFGHGVAQDLKESAYWLEKAAGTGDPSAEEELGYFYESGTGVPKDPVLAGHWYQLAASGGSVEAKTSLALLYLWGLGVPKNTGVAAQLLREAADKKDGTASYQLGCMYSDGTGVPKDDAVAERWFEKGAREHNPMAEYRLALLFLDKEHNPSNLKKAVALFRSSASSGFVPAKYSLGLTLVRTPHLAHSPQEAIELLETAASAGIWQASETLGILARDGRVGPQDIKSAYFHFQVAALQGGSPVQTRLATDLKNLSSRLNPDERSALDVQANDWQAKHHLVMQFVYMQKDRRTRYSAFGLTVPPDGGHALRLLPELPSD